MKIGYLIPEFPGQTHIWMWREISHLREWGADIHIFSTRQPDAATKARHSFADSVKGTTVYLWPQNPIYLLSTFAWALLNYPTGVYKMLMLSFSLALDAKPAWRHTLPLLLIAPVLARRALKYNIQHLHSQSAANSAILCMMVKRLVGIPFSMVCNAHLDGWGGAMGQKFSDAEFTVAVANWLYEQIQTEYPYLKPQQLIKAYLGVDTQKWKPCEDFLERVPACKNHVFRIVSVGRLHPAKGHDILIRSVKRLVDEGRMVDLKIIGSGPSKSSLISLIEELGASSFVTLNGSLSEDQIISIMAESDAFALASHHEPLGVVYMEAMAMGIPTIGTNAGGVPEIITHRNDGLLVPPNDETALKSAIQLLMDSPTFRQSLAINARKTAVERFDSRIGASSVYARLYGHPPLVIGAQGYSDKS